MHHSSLHLAICRVAEGRSALGEDMLSFLRLASKQGSETSKCAIQLFDSLSSRSLSFKFSTVQPLPTKFPRSTEAL